MPRGWGFKTRDGWTVSDTVSFLCRSHREVARRCPRWPGRLRERERARRSLSANPCRDVDWELRAAL